jgi:hypothetical protein
MSPQIMYLLTREPRGVAKYRLSDLLKHLEGGEYFETKDRVYASKAFP